MLSPVDRSKNLVGYTIGKNASVFKASEIGRKFMASQLESTWKKLHPKPVQVKVKPSAPTVTPSSRPVRLTVQTTASTQPKVQSRVQAKPVPSFTRFNIDTPIGSKAVEISTRSRIYSSMRLRFQRTMIPPQSRTLPIPQCFSLLATLMPQHPCPNPAEVVAVLPLNLVGARRMTRTNAPMLDDAFRWLIPCAS